MLPRSVYHGLAAVLYTPAHEHGVYPCFPIHFEIRKSISSLPQSFYYSIFESQNYYFLEECKRFGNLRMKKIQAD